MASPPFGQVEINRDDLKRFHRAVRQAESKELNNRLKQANKSVGQLVIDRLQPRPDPAAIGIGAGSSVRASAAKRDVVLRVGGKHREGHTPYKRWGKKAIANPFRAGRPKRPYIRETVERNRKEIEDAWMDATLKAMSGAFHATEKR